MSETTAGIPTCLKIIGATILDITRPVGTTSGDLAVIDGRFVALEALEPASRRGATIEIIDGRHRLLVPGLVNAHTHSPLNILRGTGDVLGHPAFMWLNQGRHVRSHTR